MPNWGKGVQGPQRKYVRKTRRRPAKRAVDRRQNRNISKLYRMVKYSKERKYVDQTNSDIGVASTWQTVLLRDLTFIPEGTTENTRVGTKISIHSHHLKFKVIAGDATNLYRILVVRFASEAAATVDLANVLETPTASTPLQIMSFKKRNTASKYKILWDSGVRTLGGSGASALTPVGPNTQHMYNVFLNNRGKGYYAGYNSSAAGSCVAGYTYIVACSDSLIAPAPAITTSSRTVFSG